jgi:hypothetical protein
MTEDEQQLYNQVPEDGSTVTNPELQRRLGWDRDKYWNIRNILVDRGELSVARGRGGLVYRVIQPEAPVDQQGTPPTAIAPPQIREEDLYQPISAVLNQEWAREKRLERWIVHTTARQGRRDTGGRWSRPDLVLATQSTYPYVPGRHLDVITFEVKPSDSIDVTAVYEALAHRRAATKAYVVLHVPDADADRLNDTLTEVYSEAKRHGLGVITFNQPGDFSGWEEMVEPTRQEPDPRRLNDFLATQFEAAQLETLLRWFR